MDSNLTPLPPSPGKVPQVTWPRQAGGGGNRGPFAPDVLTGVGVRNSRSAERTVVPRSAERILAGQAEEGKVIRKLHSKADALSRRPVWRGTRESEDNIDEK